MPRGRPVKPVVLTGEEKAQLAARADRSCLCSRGVERLHCADNYATDGHHTRVKWLSEREACKNVQNCLWDVDWPYENVVLACKQVITRSCLNFPNR